MPQLGTTFGKKASSGKPPIPIGSLTKTKQHNHSGTGPAWEYDGFSEKNPGYHIWSCTCPRCPMTMIHLCGMVFNFPPKCSTCDAYKKD